MHHKYWASHRIRKSSHRSHVAKFMIDAIHREDLFGAAPILSER
jgi:hypothetical protein